MSFSEWKEVELGEVCSKITKGTTPTSVGCTFTDSGINYIKSESITENRLLDNSKFAFIDSVTHEKLKRSQIIENDILFSMAGMFLGKTGIVTENDVPANTNQAVAIIRTIPELIDYKFAYYFLNQNYMVTHINSCSSQSAQPNINLKEIGDLQFTLPPLPEQKAIADTLSCLDDKIELNNRINKTLEEMAQAIFKSWFVDFEPFQDGEFEDSELGRIPKGWRVGTLGEVITFKNGKKRPNEQGDYPVYGGNGILGYTNEFCYENVIIIGRVGAYCGSLYLENEKCWISDNAISANSKNHKVQLFSYYTLKNLKLNERRIGTGQPLLTQSILNNISTIIPENNIIEGFNKLINSFYKNIKELKQQTQTLTAIRDSLLPKLMSGEIRVPID